MIPAPSSDIGTHLRRLIRIGLFIAATRVSAMPPAWLDGGASSLPSRVAGRARQAAHDAGAALARGDSATAIALIEPIAAVAPESLSPDAMLTWGVALFEAHRMEAAAEALDHVRDGELAPYAAYYRGEADFYLDHLKEAAAEFASAAGSKAAIAEHAARRRAETLLRARDPGAQAAFAAILRQGETADLVWGRLNAARIAHDPGLPVLLRDFWLRFPEHPGAESIERAVTMGRPVPVSDRLDRSERLLKKGLAKRALQEADLAASSATSAERPAVDLSRAKAFLAMRDAKDAEAPIRNAIDSGNPEVIPEAMFLLGRVKLRDSDPAGARKAFDDVVAKFPTTPIADEAAFLSAWSFFEARDFAKCAAAFAALEKSRPSSPHAAEQRWYAGFCYYQTGQRSAAAAELEELTRRHSSSFAQQAVYWRARALESSDKATSLQLDRQLVRTAPWSWYGELAASRIAALGGAPEPAALPKASESIESLGMGLLSHLPFSQASLAVRLAEAGLVADADIAFQAVARSMRDARSAEELAAMAAALHLWGRAYSIANGHLWGRAFGERSAVAVALLYPRAYRDVVEGSARHESIDAYFLWSIMRRESGFVPTARSGARARGLMQLLTRTARRVALVTGRPLPHPRSLYQPANIVPLAAWYLSSLAGRFGDAALAAAAYNAGTSATAQWARALADTPLDEFVELMPYKETRGYVKGVIGDYLAYRAIYSATTPSLSVPQRMPKPSEGVEF
jgi:soluble lytic murein transglycosylase